MKTSLSLRHRAALWILLGSASACHSLPQTEAASVTPTTAQLWQQLQAESQRQPCQNDRQCHSLGVGAKACGGPERYLAWSDYQRSAQQIRQLHQLAERYGAARRADDEREQLMSNCALVPDPGAVCHASRCELRAPVLSPASVQ